VCGRIDVLARDIWHYPAESHAELSAWITIGFDNSVASRPPGYVVYLGYAQPVYAPGCYWASQPVYDGAGRLVGYTGRPVQVCPGYAEPR
jgi:hypothetical protein